MASGLYKITNTLTNQSYIGRSIHIEQRWTEHIKGKGNKKLSEDFKKIGIHNFTFEILEECSDIQLLIEKEEYWIKYFDSFNNGYNLNQGGDNCEQATSKTKKQVFCYDLEGKYIKKYDSLSQAEKDLNISNSLISRAIKTEGRTKQYQWRYEFHETINPYKRKNTTKGKTVTKNIKPVKQYTLTNEFIKEYPSIAAASQETGVCNTSISEVCRNKRFSAGGFIWSFK